jgi:hypothetical protein
MTTLTEIQKAYLAGIIDGEGCIGINILPSHSGTVKRLQLRVLVANTNYQLISWLCETTGIGYVFKKIRKNNPKAKDGYEWIVNSLKALWLLHQVKDYLVIKKEQASVAIEFQNTIDPCRHGIFVPQEIVERRYELKKLMNELNKKGVSITEKTANSEKPLLNSEATPNQAEENMSSGVRRD